MSSPREPSDPWPDPFDPRRYAAVSSLTRDELVAIAARALDLMPVVDITRAETHANQLARLLRASEPYRDYVTKEPETEGESSPKNVSRCPYCRGDCPPGQRRALCVLLY